MKIQPQNNRYFTFYNANPKGKKCADCVVRAISLACHQTWEETVREMTEFGIKKGLVLNDQKLYPLYLKEKGFREMNEPRNYDNTKMTAREWIDSSEGWRWHRYTIVAKLGSHHLACIYNNKVFDSWDSSNQTMHKWWVK